MGKEKLNIGANLMEETIHGDYGFPFQIDHKILSQYEQNRFGCHWHSDLEFTVVLDGAMEYQVNDTVYRLTTGCGMFVNANCLHTAWSYEGMDCIYKVITVNPVLIYGYENSIAETSYVSPLLKSQEFSSCFLNTKDEKQNRIIKILLEIGELYSNRPACFQLLIQSKLCELWSILYQEFQTMTKGKERAYSKDIPRLKQALNYIHQNYAEKLTLDEISRSCNISKSEFCRFFKKIMRQSPFEYLLNYRIQKSIPLLLGNERNVTEISETVGFISASYFSEIFRRYMYCSPTEYRNRHKA
jgi:AraC family transcriptional regulator, melibiose operon regulatory protein